MHGGRDRVKLRHAACGNEQTQGELTVRFLVERTDYVAQVVYGIVGSFGTGSGIERCRILPGHDAGEHADFEEADELLLLIDLTACCG